MISVKNKFLPEAAFADLQAYCKESEFEEVKVGDRVFSTLKTPNYLLELLQIPNHDLVLTFIRRANTEYDTSLFVHADNIVNGQKIAIASVLYINETEGITPNGTAFYNHVKYGAQLPDNVTDEEYDRLLTEDANDISKWRQTDIITAYPNRLLKYSANQFHSAWPKVITEGDRIVLVAFYSKK